MTSNQPCPTCIVPALWDLGKPKLSSTCTFIAYERNLGQGNVFTRVCYSVHSWGGGSAYRGVCIQWGWTDPLPRDTWDTTVYSQQAGSTHPDWNVFLSWKSLQNWYPFTEILDPPLKTTVHNKLLVDYMYIFTAAMQV